MFRRLAVVLTATSLSLAHAAPETRCALDIGSGSTKIVVATVDPARQLVVAVRFRAEDAVSYKKELTADQILPDAIIEKGVAVMRELMGKATKAVGAALPPCTGVATAVFREARNGASAVASLARATGTTLTVISQDDEAKLGFIAGATAAAEKLRADVALDRVVVWDIGSASMQITTRENGPAGERFSIYKGLFASDPMTKFLLDRQIARAEKAADAKSPNPVAAPDVEAGVERSRAEARGVPAAVAARLAGREAVVVGVGGVHAKSVSAQLGLADGGSFDRARLAAAVRARTGWTDAQLGGGKYAANQLANLILVLGYVEELSIPRVIALDVNLADGLLVRPDFVAR